MGNKVPNSLLKRLCVCVCVCMCGSVGAFVLLCMYVCVCKVNRGMWNWATNAMKNVTENSFCGVSIFSMKGLTSLEFNDHVMGCGFFGGISSAV